MRPFLVFAFAAVSLVCGLATAQTAYRCGNSYSQSPCANGTAVDIADPRSAAQKRDTDEAVRRNAQAADAMEKTRMKEEARLDNLRVKQARVANDTKRIDDANARYAAESKRRQQIQNNRSKVVLPDYVITAKPDGKKKRTPSRQAAG